MTDRPAARDYFGRQIPFLDLIDLVPVSMTDGTVKALLPARPELCNSTGHVHGGRLMTALDFLMSAVARSSDPDRIAVSTIDMTTSFLSGATGEIHLEARCLRRGRAIAFCEAQATDAQGRLVAKCSGTFSVRLPE